MEALRTEAEDSSSKAEELQAKVKTLEQENLQKEQEITSLQHKQRMLEQEVEKLEEMHGKAKKEADVSAQHGTQNEGLQRKVQLLEEEAEENDKNLRETNEKYVQYFVYAVTCRASMLTVCGAQAPPNRRQSRALRAQSAGSRGRPRPVGIQVRGNVEEVFGHEEGTR